LIAVTSAASRIAFIVVTDSAFWSMDAEFSLPTLV
jgi:hypothetical protein